MPSPKVGLITGVSSGIGQSTARLLATKGYTVFGTARKPEACPPIPAVEMLPLDVTSNESVSACVDAVMRRMGRLDVLVNNAGYVLVGAVEEVTLEEPMPSLKRTFSAR